MKKNMIKLQAAWVDFRDHVVSIAADHGLDEFMEGRPAPAEWKRWPSAVINTLKIRIECKLCELRGHDLHDDGYANGDSGCVHICCHRCGYSSGRIYLY